MEEDISPQDRKYVEVYQNVSHELQQKKDPELIIQDLMAEGYTEKDANQWVAAVASQLRSRMVQRSLFTLISGVVLLALGLYSRIFAYDAAAAFDATAFETGLIIFGAILLIWGVSSWAKYRQL